MRNIRHRLKNRFIPNPENDHKPSILGPRVIAFVCMVAFVGELAFVFSSVYLVPRSKLYGVVQVNALVDETNQNRTANNVPQLQVSPLLQAAAQEKANDMASKGYFAHTSPQGLTPWYWFESVGYNFDYAGENLAVNFSDSQDVTNAWMNSAEHRANILDTDYTQIGIATAQGIYKGQSATYVVEEFGTPAPVTAPVSFVNTAAAASVPTTGPIAPVPTPVVKTAKQPTKVAAKPASAAVQTPVAVVPTVVAMQNNTGSNPASAQTFVAVKGAQAGNGGTVTAPNGSVTTGGQAIGLAEPQSNWIQRLSANPKAVANGFYMFLIILFGIATVLNFFIKIRIQYPRLIAGGLIVIVISGLCIMLNQDIGLLHASIL